MYTSQQKALERVTLLFGRTAFTEDHVDYRRVGCKIGPNKFSAIGASWDQAIEGLQAKVESVPFADHRPRYPFTRRTAA
jgi:hypothetical protein